MTESQVPHKPPNESVHNVHDYNSETTTIGIPHKEHWLYQGDPTSPGDICISYKLRLDSVVHSVAVRTYPTVTL